MSSGTVAVRRRAPRTSETHVIDSTRAMRCAIGVLVYGATLPLQWQEAAVSGAGVLRYHHIGALLMIAIAWPPGPAFRQVVVRLRPLPVAFLVLTIASVSTAIVWQGRPVNYVQTLVYAMIGLVGAAAMLTAMQTERSRRVLSWTGPAAFVTFAISYYLTALEVGVEPIQELLKGIQTADPVRLQTRLFTVVFRTADETARGNMRHEIMAALVVTGAIGVGVASTVRRSSRLTTLTMTAVVFVCAVSLSRSILLALALVLLPVLLRLLSNGDLSPARFFGIVVLAFAAPAAIAFGAQLLLARFTDTRSYESRLGAYNLPGHELIDRVLIGGPQLPESTHTLPFDALLEGSIIAFIAAVLLVIVFCALAASGAARYLRTGSALGLAVVTAMAVPIVRSFTAGGGQIAGAGWVAVAFSVAALIYLETQPSDEPPPNPSVDVTADTTRATSRTRDHHRQRRRAGQNNWKKVR